MLSLTLSATATRASLSAPRRVSAPRRRGASVRVHSGGNKKSGEIHEELKEKFTTGGGGYKGFCDYEEIREAIKECDGLGAFYTLVPIRPRLRGERRSLRTFAVVSPRPTLAFNPRPRCLSTSTDAFQLHPDIRLYGTTLRRRAAGGVLRGVRVRRGQGHGTLRESGGDRREEEKGGRVSEERTSAMDGSIREGRKEGGREGERRSEK